MLLAAAGAIYLRVNLPIALAACWITNPVTAVPIYLFAWRLGRTILENVFLIEDLFDMYPLQGAMGKILQQTAYLWAGSLCIATLSSVLTLFAVRTIWVLSARLYRTSRKKPD